MQADNPDQTKLKMNNTSFRNATRFRHGRVTNKYLFYQWLGINIGRGARSSQHVPKYTCRILLTRKPPNLFEATTISATQNISPPVEHVLILSLLLDVFDGPGNPNDAGFVSSEARGTGAAHQGASCCAQSPATSFLQTIYISPPQPRALFDGPQQWGGL
jgi:hypothetical protein